MNDAAGPWKVVVIVEDDSDGRAIAELVARTDQPVQFDWLPAGGIGNIKRNAERLITLARDRVEQRRGCVAVLVDRDRKNPSRDEPHRTIARACRRGKVEFVVAQEALEAWFLADPGVCGWLGLAPPATTDTIRDPKQRVSQAFHRTTGRPYRKRRARLEVARHSTGIDVGKNGSAQQAFAAIAHCLGRK
jgi:hypothetical protein